MAPVLLPTTVFHNTRFPPDNTMRRNGSARRSPRSWKTFSARDGACIDETLRSGLTPVCPCCGETLEAQPESRLSPCVVLDATAYDLSCRDCRRFWCVVRHTQRSIRFLRMRRFAAAVRAVRLDDRDTAPAVAAGSAA